MNKNRHKGNLLHYKGYDNVIRSMISEEIALQHKSLGWLNAIQGFLLAGVCSSSWVYNNKEILLCICVLGIMCCVIGLFTYLTSETKIQRILYFWNGYLRHTNQSYFDFPPVSAIPDEDETVPSEYIKAFGIFRVSMSRKIARKFIHQKVIYPVFCLGWCIIYYFLY